MNKEKEAGDEPENQTENSEQYTELCLFGLTQPCYSATITLSGDWKHNLEGQIC